MTRMKMNFKLYERYNGRLDLRDVLFKQVKLKLSFPAMMDFKRANESDLLYANFCIAKIENERKYAKVTGGILSIGVR